MIKAFFAPTEKRAGSETAHALLGYVFKLIYGAPLPRMEKTILRKPYFPHRPDVFFSLSHTSTYVMCAVSPKPVGADVEKIRPVPSHLPERVCSPEEREHFSFFDSWVLKESFIKTYGDSRVTVRGVTFSKSGDEILTPSPNVSARLYGCIPGCAAALCAVSNDFPESLIFVERSKFSGYY